MIDLNKIYSNQIKSGFSTNSPAITAELHLNVKNYLLSILGEDYFIKAQDNGEAKVEGAFYKKKVDVAVFKDNELKGVVEIKSFRASYNKNANNHFENMYGATANLTLAGLPVFQLILLPEDVQVNNREVVSYEAVKDTQLAKYMNMTRQGNLIKEAFLCLHYFSFNWETLEASPSQYKYIQDEELKEWLKKQNVNSQLYKFALEIKKTEV